MVNGPGSVILITRSVFARRNCTSRTSIGRLRTIGPRIRGTVARPPLRLMVVLGLLQPGVVDPPDLRRPQPRHLRAELVAVDQPAGLGIAPHHGRRQNLVHVTSTRIEPRRSIDASITSPGRTGPTPCGVPVSSTSPGCSV